MEASRQKIGKMSRILKMVFIIAACMLPVFDAGFWITNGYPFLNGSVSWEPFRHCKEMIPLEEMSANIKFLGFLVTLIPTAFYVAAFLLLARLFGFFQQLEFFSTATVRCLRKIGYCILFSQLIYPVYSALISLTLTISNPPGSRVISVTIGMTQLSLLTIALIIILISWIMDEGRKLQEEQAATI